MIILYFYGGKGKWYI